MPLPFSDSVSSAQLRGFDSITFDPLGVAAVLNNPRADLSAARLYVQSDRRAFRWPHTTMIGGECVFLTLLTPDLGLLPCLTSSGDKVSVSGMLFRQLNDSLLQTDSVLEFA